MKWDETGKNIQSHGNLLFDVCLYIGKIDMTSTKWRHEKSKHAVCIDSRLSFKPNNKETPWETHSSVTDTAKTGDAEIIEAKISSTTATQLYTGHDLVLHKQFCAFKATTTEHINPHHPRSIILNRLFLDNFPPIQLNWSCRFLSFLEFWLEFFQDFAWVEFFHELLGRFRKSANILYFFENIWW